MKKRVEIELPKKVETGVESFGEGMRGFWRTFSIVWSALVLGVILGGLAFFARWIIGVTAVGYDFSDAISAMRSGVFAELATRPYSRGVDEALSSGEFLAENLGAYYGVEYVEGGDFTERVNRLTEVGYDAEGINLVNQKLGETEVEWIEKQEYLPDLAEMLGLEYFRAENLARYFGELEGAKKKEAENSNGARGELRRTEVEATTEAGGTNGGAEVEEAGKEATNGRTEVEEAVIRVNIGLDLEPYEDATEVTEFDELMLVNKYHFLGEDFVPEGLTAIRADCVKGGQNLQLSGVAEVAFEEMCLAARAEGLNLVANSAYRGYTEQKEVMTDTAKQFGQEYAEEYVSRPGFSEHQTGLALDVAATNANYFPITSEYQWVLTNAEKYGFILRYPEGKKEITGYNPEAWHLRYVGKELAKELQEKGLTLEEYWATK